LRYHEYGVRESNLLLVREELLPRTEYPSGAAMQLDHASTSGGKRLSAPISLDSPLFTVVTVVFNGEKDLESSILSVLNQSYRNVEYIIIDGGSTDGTLDILRRYEDAIDYWVSEPDNGIYDAMNKAIRLARGKWVYFLGSDDTLRNCLEIVAGHLKDERTIYFGTVHTSGIKPITQTPLLPWQLLRRNICQQAIFYPRALFEWRTFDLRYRILADWEFNMRCYSSPHFGFQYIPVVVANYNNLTGISSVSIDEQFRFDQADIIRECLPAACYVWHRIKGLAHLAIDGVQGKR
jgi:glycosyltransferase involved in cell wall biosynthesis